MNYIFYLNLFCLLNLVICNILPLFWYFNDKGVVNKINNIIFLIMIWKFSGKWNF